MESARKATLNYDSQKFAQIYNYHPDFGALSYDLGLRQYGVEDGMAKDPTRYHLIFKTQLNVISDMIKDDLDILDLGCGEGHVIEKIINKNNRVTGVDISIERIRQSRDRLNSNRVNLLNSDAVDLPFKNGKFDLVIASELIEHLPDSRELLANIKRVLKMDGVLILSTPCSYLSESSAERIYEWQHVFVYSYNKLLRIVEEAGFSIKKAYGIGLKSPKLTIPVWCGSPLVKFVYCKLKGVKPKSGYRSPVYLQFDLLSNPFFNKLYFISKNKRYWAALVDFLSFWGGLVPVFASQIVIIAQKDEGA